MNQLQQDIGNSVSARVVIPVCHIYLEHILNMLIQKKYLDSKTFLDNHSNGFKNKIDLLLKINALSNKEYHDLNLMNQVRNDFVHTFKPDLNEISEKIFQMKFHVFNKKRNPVEVILYDIIQLMSLLDQKIH